MPFGYLDTRYVDFPPNVDAAYLRGLQTRAGVSFADLLREIDARLAAFNAAVDPLVGALVTPTSEAFIDATGAAPFQVEERGEYTLARPQLVEAAAHMLPLRGYEAALGFTEGGLERMSRTRILNLIDSVLLGFRALHRKEALRRLFSNAEVRVDATTTATSPGFAGSGTGENAFKRTHYPDGTPLPNGYTHYFVATTSGSPPVSNLPEKLREARDRLARWHAPPYDLIAPQAQIDAIAAINPGNAANGFVSAGSELVRPGALNAEAQVDATIYLGVLYGDIRVHRAVTDYSTPHIAIFKSYGALDPRNPLAWRYDEQRGRGATLRYRSLYPLDQAVIRQDFGIGVNDRTGAVLVYARTDNVNTYVNPNW